MNKKWAAAVFVFFLGTFSSITGQEPRSEADGFSERLAAMQDSDHEKAVKAMTDWEEYCFKVGAPDRQDEKKEAIRLMKNALADPSASKVHFWFLHQLCRIGDESCVGVIGSFLDNPDRRIRDEALFALGSISGEAADRFLAERLVQETDAEKKTALQSMVTYRSGRSVASAPTLDQIMLSLERPEPNAADYVLPRLNAIENPAIADLPDFKKRFSALSTKSKILLIDALTKVRDRTVLPTALDLLKSDDESLRLAALRALGPLGDASVLPLLVARLGMEGREADTACDSIVRLNFEGADRALLDAYDRASDMRTRIRLINAFSKRRGTIGVPLFEKELDSPDEAMRSAAIDALLLNGDRKAIPLLVRRLDEEEKKEIADKLARALVELVRFSPERAEADELLYAEFQKRDASRRNRLLAIWGKVGGNRAREIILEQVADPSNSAAFSALCDWPDASVGDTLYRIAVNKTDSRSPRAIRAFLRVITLPSSRSGKDSVALFQKGIDVAGSDENKNFLLSRLGHFRNRDVFDFLVTFFDDPKQAGAARRAVLDQCNDFWFHMNNRAKIDPVLDRIIEMSPEKWQVDQAANFKARRAR